MLNNVYVWRFRRPISNSHNGIGIPWNSLSFGMCNGHEWVYVAAQDACVTVICQRRLQTYSAVPYHANIPSHITKRLRQLEQSLVDMQGPYINEVVSIRVHDHPPDSVGNETRQIRQRVFNPQQFSKELRQSVKLLAVQSAKYTSGPAAPKVLINDDRSKVLTLTLVDLPALKSAAIFGSVASLSRLRIIVSHRLSHSSNVFFRQHRYRRFDVLPDT